MKSSCKQGPVIISDSDSDDNLQPPQRKPICEAPPELVEEVHVQQLRKDIQCLFQVTNKMNFPWSLQAPQGDIPMPHLLLHRNFSKPCKVVVSEDALSNWHMQWATIANAIFYTIPNIHTFGIQGCNVSIQ